MERALSTLVAVACASIAQSRQVPGGLTGRVLQAYTKPTPGKLQQLLVWLADAGAGALPTELSLFLVEQKKGSAWLPQMAQLRNRWAHPKDESPGQALEEVAHRLEHMPTFIREERLRVTSEGRASWRTDDRELALAPFAFADGNGLVVLRELSLSGEPTFTVDAPGPHEQFRTAWFELRVLDPALNEPVAPEVIEKVRRRARSHSGDPPWWLDRLETSGASAFLIDAGQLDGSMAAFKNAGIPSLVLALQGDQSPTEELASALGLAEPLSAQQTAACAVEAGPLRIAFQTSALASRAFLQVLYWLADVPDAGAPSRLRILVERPADILEADQEKLWDRLPDSLETLLEPPPRSGRSTLSDFVWTATKPGRFLGLF